MGNEASKVEAPKRNLLQALLVFLSGFFNHRMTPPNLTLKDVDPTNFSASRLLCGGQKCRHRSREPHEEPAYKMCDCPKTRLFM